jgi:DNA-binding response OmpR family regulator
MAADKNGKIVLVIDDDPMARDLYRAILEADGFEVLDEGEGEKGLEVYKSTKVDCVILDIFMPGLSGLDLLEQLDPDTTGVPVIAVSGSGHAAGSSPLHLAETLGASKGFSKGFEHEELLGEVRKLTGLA